MFCDLVGSTSLAAKLDPEDWRNLVGSYLDAASAAVTSLGGHVLKKLGDGLMALFHVDILRRVPKTIELACPGLRLQIRRRRPQNLKHLFLGFSSARPGALTQRNAQ